MSKKKTRTKRGRPRARKAPPHSGAHPPTPRSPTRPPSTRARPTSLPRFLTVDEVADLLRTSRRAIYAKIRRNALPGVIQLPRRLLVDSEALLDWLDQKRAVSPITQGDQR
ncbi:MAG: helix-turn-helix domain-containing protein [Myxococcales bacterium]|nr:helix-turn-helix domain-containing protein [Myxococcales bacterium]